VAQIRLPREGVTINRAGPRPASRSRWPRAGTCQRIGVELLQLPLINQDAPGITLARCHAQEPQKTGLFETMPTWLNLRCHKSDCGCALNRFGASVASTSKVTICGCLLFAAGCLYGDRVTRIRGTRRGLRARQELRIGQNNPTTSQRNCSSRPAPEAFCCLMEIALDATPAGTTISSWRRSC
jgi:hypothetical protein